MPLRGRASRQQLAGSHEFASEGGNGGPIYQSQFECVPFDAPVRPASRTAKPRVHGPQTAIVTGPEGEEIHTDEHARIHAWSQALADDSGPLNDLVMRVRMTDPRWLEGLAIGKCWGTVAFDVWRPDPHAPSDAEIAAVTAEASRWPEPPAV